MTPSHDFLRIAVVLTAVFLLYGHILAAVFGGEVLTWQLGIFVVLTSAALAGMLKDRRKSKGTQ